MTQSSNNFVPVIKLVIGIILIIILKAIALSLLPINSALIYIHFATAIVICFLLISFIKNYQNNIKLMVPKYIELVLIAKNLIYLVVVIILYKPLSLFALVYFREYFWIALTIAIFAGGFFLIKAGLIFYKSMESLTNLFLNSAKKNANSSSKDLNCSKCNTQFIEGTKFCNNCGNKLIE